MDDAQTHDRQADDSGRRLQRVEWFGGDRPVSGGTVFVRSEDPTDDTTSPER